MAFIFYILEVSGGRGYEVSTLEATAQARWFVKTRKRFFVPFIVSGGESTIGPSQFERGFTTGTTGAVAVPRDRPARPRGEANVLPVTAGEPGREEGGDWGAKKKNFAATKTKISKFYK